MPIFTEYQVIRVKSFNLHAYVGEGLKTEAFFYESCVGWHTFDGNTFNKQTVAVMNFPNT